MLSKETYKFRKEHMKYRIEQMINYAYSKNKCRSQLLLMYFGEKDPNRCGYCDVCLERNRLQLSTLEFDQILIEIKTKLQEKAYSLEQLKEETSFPKEKFLKVFQWLIDNGKIVQLKNFEYRWVKKSS